MKIVQLKLIIIALLNLTLFGITAHAEGGARGQYDSLAPSKKIADPPVVLEPEIRIPKNLPKAYPGPKDKVSELNSKNGAKLLDVAQCYDADEETHKSSLGKLCEAVKKPYAKLLAKGYTQPNEKMNHVVQAADQSTMQARLKELLPETTDVELKEFSSAIVQLQKESAASSMTVEADRRKSSPTSL